MPCESRPDLFQIYVLVLHHHLAENTFITVASEPLHGNGFTEDHARQVLFCLIAEGLFTLWRVNACQSDFMLRMIRIEDSNRISIGNTHDAPYEGLSLRGRRPRPQEKQQETFEKNTHQLFTK